MRKLGDWMHLGIAAGILTAALSGCKGDELQRLRVENSELRADIETSQIKIAAMEADPELELLRDANATLESQIESARIKADEVDSRIDDIETQIGRVDSAIEDFKVKEWQLVVPDVRDQANTAHARVDDTSRALNGLKELLAEK